MNPRGRQLLGRTPAEWLVSLPVILLLLFTLVIGTGEMVHSQLLKLGETMFGEPAKGLQYFMLRGDNPMPSCSVVTDIDAEVAKQAESANASSGELGDLFGVSEPVDPAVIRNAIVSANELCQKQLDQYQMVKAADSPKLRQFVALETGFYHVFSKGIENRPLILLVMLALAALTTTRGVHHVSIRPPLTRLDYRFAVGSVALASAITATSFVSYYFVSKSSGVAMEHEYMYFIWVSLFLALTGISVAQWWRPPSDMQPGGKVSSALLSVPLFGAMGVVCGLYFFLHLNMPGVAIYVSTLLELPSIFLSLALYIWAGMLLKQSRVVDLFMNILRPWKLSPELLTYIILLAAALPTAYTGASGIFVIAAGGIVYNEVRAAGGTRQFALAATAMSGSLGVVLRPCLLVVLIAALNKQVTSNDLYHWGHYVFLLTSTLFFLFSQLTRRKKANLERPLVAIPKMLREVVPVLPYAALVVAVVWFYEYFLNTPLNESTAPVIMPSIMFFVLIFDKLRTPKPSAPTHPDAAVELAPVTDAHHKDRQEGVEKSIRFATSEATGDIGALIMLMAMSLAVGGLVERSEVMQLAPAEFSSAWTAMTFLMITKVILGMFMDPFGAVILVSGTLAPIAYNNGIDPLHFWMMVLVAFELGYLMPPVALNQLLTRLVIGDSEVRLADGEVKRKKFYWRYERWILPSIVMTVGMLITAYGPLAVQKWTVLRPVANYFMPEGTVLQEQPTTPDRQDPDVDLSAAAAASGPAPAPPPLEEAAPPAAEAEVAQVVQQWATDWSGKNVEAYLAHYAPEFVSADGVPRPAWDDQRKTRLLGKKQIQVSVEGLSVAAQTDKAVALFTQVYQSDSLNETVTKELTFKSLNGRWLIVAERVLK